MDEQDMRDTIEEVRMDSWEMFSKGVVRMDEQDMRDSIVEVRMDS